MQPLRRNLRRYGHRGHDAASGLFGPSRTQSPLGGPLCCAIRRAHTKPPGAFCKPHFPNNDGLHCGLGRERVFVQFHRKTEKGSGFIGSVNIDCALDAEMYHTIEVIAKPRFCLRLPFLRPLQSRVRLYSGAAHQLR